MTAPSHSLEQRLIDVEAALRSLLAGNWTERASVVNAAGAWVPLSQLAFGLVSAADLGYTELNGGNPAPAPGGVGWIYGTPQLDVLVNGGSLLVFTAGQLHAQGNKCGMYQSYRLLGPTAEPSAAGPQAVGPSYDRAVEAFDPGYGQGTDVGAGTFGSHTGLAPGYYRVQSAYAISFSGGMFTYGSAVNRRIAALPF
jgi:hypothetical protein